MSHVLCAVERVRPDGVIFGFSFFLQPGFPCNRRPPPPLPFVPSRPWFSTAWDDLVDEDYPSVAYEVQNATPPVIPDLVREKRRNDAVAAAAAEGEEKEEDPVFVSTPPPLATLPPPLEWGLSACSQCTPFLVGIGCPPLMG